MTIRRLSPRQSAARIEASGATNRQARAALDVVDAEGSWAEALACTRVPTSPGRPWELREGNRPLFPPLARVEV